MQNISKKEKGGGAERAPAAAAKTTTTPTRFRVINVRKVIFIYSRFLYLKTNKCSLYFSFNSVPLTAPLPITKTTKHRNKNKPSKTKYQQFIYTKQLIKILVKKSKLTKRDYMATLFFPLFFFLLFHSFFLLKNICIFLSLFIFNYLLFLK